MGNRRVYISGKITGDECWKEKFRLAEEALKRKGYTVLTPTFIEAEIGYEDYMHIDFAMIDVCDSVYFLPDWMDSSGAIREYNYARATRKTILNMELKEKNNCIWEIYHENKSL